MKHIKAFTTQAEVATYEQSSNYVEPYIGASYDSVTAHYNHNTPIYKQFYDYDDETHQYNLYEQVEYIANPNKGYINTGLYASSNTKVECSVKFTEISRSQAIFGCRTKDSTTQNSFVVWGLDSNTFRNDFIGTINTVSGITVNASTTYNITKQAGTLTVNNNSSATITGTLTNNSTTLYIFNVHQPNPSASQYFTGQLYYFKVYNSNTLMRDFIPVKRINDNVYGLWDRVNNKFYVSPNGTQFTGGAKMIYDVNDVQYQQVEYIANPNKGYINTGLYASSNTKVECSVKFTEISRSQAIFGCRTKDSTTQNSFVVWGLDSNTFRNDFIGTINTVSGITVNASTTYNITKQAGTLTVNNNSSATITGTLTNNSTTLYIFNVHQPNPSASQYFTGQLYYFKVYNSNTLMRDFIPVKRVSDSKYGLFDRVNRMFYTAGNNIEFTGA